MAGDGFGHPQTLKGVIMATSVVKIINNGLAKIGQEAITSLTEDSEAARLSNLIFEQTRDDVLSDHVWNFAVRRVQLAQSVDTPAFEYAYQYALPSDCLKVLGMSEKTMTYEIESGYLLTDEGTALIKYIRRVTDPNEFSPKFVEALSARIASELSIPLAESTTLQQNMTELYIRKLSDAKSVDSQESGASEIEADTWLESRLNYGGTLIVGTQ